MVVTDILHGVWFGVVLSLCFSIGPAFFSLLQTSMHYGYKVAKPFPFGVNMNDIIVVVLLLTVLSDIDVPAFMHRPSVAIVGAVVLLAFGVHTAMRKAVDAKDSGEAVKFGTNDSPKWYNMYFRGLTVNMFNPSIWIYWAGAIALASSTYDLSTDRLYIFFIGVLVTTVSLDLLKCKLASMLQRFLTVKVLNTLNKFVGLVFLGFAIYLLCSAQWHA